LFVTQKTLLLGQLLLVSAMLAWTQPIHANPYWRISLVSFPEDRVWREGSDFVVLARTLFLLTVHVEDTKPVATELSLTRDSRLWGCELWVFLTEGRKLVFNGESVIVPVSVENPPISIALTAVTPMTQDRTQLQLLYAEMRRERLILESVSVNAFVVSPAEREKALTQQMADKMVTGLVGALGVGALIAAALARKLVQTRRREIFVPRTSRVTRR